MSTKQDRKNVRFVNADIVEFEPTVWTASVTSGGVPLGMSYEERGRSRRRLDSYENERTTSRITREFYMQDGYIEPTEREQILESTGHRSVSFDIAEEEMDQINQERAESNEQDGKYQFGLGQASLLEFEDSDADFMSHMVDDSDSDISDDEMFLHHGTKVRADDKVCSTRNCLEQNLVASISPVA